MTDATTTDVTAEGVLARARALLAERGAAYDAQDGATRAGRLVGAKNLLPLLTVAGRMIIRPYTEGKAHE